MAINRKEFFRKACISGAYLCGFGALGASAESFQNQPDDSENLMFREWLSNLLTELNEDDETTKKAIKSAAIAHYNQLKMDEMLAPYVGDLDKFTGFISEKWGWKIDFDKTTKTLIADENKDYCVCPVLPHNVENPIPAMCYCSEGFAEKMFSKVYGASVSATVISSVRKGDKSCRYKVVFS
jgi:hypothetical protein